MASQPPSHPPCPPAAASLARIMAGLAQIEAAVERIEHSAASHDTLRATVIQTIAELDTMLVGKDGADG